VQEPSTIEFSSSDLSWSKVRGWRQNVDNNVALIPFSRVKDFVKGECSSAECPTRFLVAVRRKKAEGSSYKPGVAGYLEYIIYWCCYGPDDRRKGGTSRPSRKCIKPSERRRAGRPHTKSGCLCHFIVKRLYARPYVALITYNQQKHVDKSGSPCHGPLDDKPIGTSKEFRLWITKPIGTPKKLRLWITSMLYLGFSVESIMQKHMKAIEKHGGPSNRDDRLFLNYVLELKTDLRQSTYELDSDDDDETDPPLMLVPWKWYRKKRTKVRELQKVISHKIASDKKAD